MRSVLFLVLAAGFVAAVRFLPWWGLLALFGGAVLAGVLAVKLSLPRLLKAPFKAKGAVLRGATAQVHSVERAEAPADNPDDGRKRVAPGEPREHYLVDVTITPRPATGAFALWAPGELVVVGPGARAEEPEADESAGEVCVVEVEHDGQFEVDSGMKYLGPQRLRLLVATPPGQRRLRLRYYFEVFGDVALPPRPVPAGRSPFARAR
jgi:hypothetical protein